MGLVPSVSNGGSATFVDHGGVTKVSKALLRRHYNRAAKTIVSFWVFNSDLLPDVGVFLALSSSCNCLILALAAVSLAWGFETVTISLSEVLEGPAADLLAAMFCGMVTKVLGNSG